MVERDEKAFAAIENTIAFIGASFTVQLFKLLLSPSPHVIVIKDFITIVFYMKNYPNDMTSLFYSLFPMECEIRHFLHRALRATLMANEPADVPD